MAALDQSQRLVDRTKTIRQPFFAKDKQVKIGDIADDDVYGGFFLTSEESKADGASAHGKQNKHHGSKHKRMRKAIQRARRRNRS